MFFFVTAEFTAEIAESAEKNLRITSLGDPGVLGG